MTGAEPERDANPISDVRLVQIRELNQYGFSDMFMYLASTGFPDSGRYAGDIRNIGL